MGTFKSLEEAREFYRGDKFCSTLGIQIDELGEQDCVCSMAVTDGLNNAAGNVMGGAIFTLADFAFAVASNQVHMPTVAQQVSINFMSVPRGKRLVAAAKIRRSGRTSCIVNIDVTDEDGNDVAQFIGTGFKL